MVFPVEGDQMGIVDQRGEFLGDAQGLPGSSRECRINVGQET
jgi:hypothetical protein